MTPTLEDLLRKQEEGKNFREESVLLSPPFDVAVQSIKEDCVHFIIHPSGINGDTLDFEVRGNELKQLNV